MRSLVHVRLGLLYLAATATVSILVFTHEAAPSRAHHDGTHSMAAMSLDMLPSATPANDAFSIGSREACARIDENDVQDTTGPFAFNPEDGVDQQFIDVTADGITPYNNNGTPSEPADDTGGLIGYQYDLGYTSGSLIVVAHDLTNPPGKLDSNPGSSSPFNPSDPLPDSDGRWTAAALDTNSPIPSTPESGDGVLGRITLESTTGAMTGVHTVSLSNNAHLDAQGTAYIPHVTNSAFISINQACPGTATITVDSTADNNTSDTVVTLREAMLLAIGGTGGDGTSTGLGRALSASEEDNVAGVPGASSADEITFATAVFPVAAAATISLGVLSSLPALTGSDADRIDGANAGVIIDGVTDSFTCFSIPGSNKTIVRIETITNCSTGVVITGASNIVGGTNEAETVCSGSADDDATSGDGFVNDGCPQVLSTAEQGANCSNAIDDDLVDNDGAVNDGCPPRGEGSVISGHAQNAILISGVGADNNAVLGNYIGTDVHGAAASANGAGIRIEAGGSSNTIGGSTAGTRNLISGSSTGGFGVAITGSGSNSNSLKGNYIGTNAAGNAAIANPYGVKIEDGALNNTVGGTTAGERNVISGNAGSGVQIAYGFSGATGNVVVGNYIGTNAAGSAAIPNADGVYVSGGADNVIGGTTPGAGNLLSGNSRSGAYLFGSNATGNQVQGNYIGTNAAGTGDLGNAFYGVVVGYAVNNTIGGTTAEARNVISGNNSYGVLIHASTATANQVKGNYIGTNAAGTAALGNSSAGVYIYDAANNNTIGGATAGERNVISGNLGAGVEITGTGTEMNAVRGNYIGLNAAASASIPNSTGVQITAGAKSNTIGGSPAGQRNIISGNTVNGVLIQGGGTNSNTVKGNYIGTDPAGSADKGNSRGVYLNNGANSNVIGGSSSGEGNVISGNDSFGILIELGATGTQIQGNYIGTNAGGSAALANSGPGIQINSALASTNTVGGATSGARNVISGNVATGTGAVVISSGGATGNIVLGNFIGTNADGTLAIPNTGAGVRVAGATGNTIGGTAPGSRNVIAANTTQGISLEGANNTVQGNLIGTDVTGTIDLGNTGSGIEIGVTANGNTIGGTATGAGNVISGNGIHGIGIQSASNVVQGNFIGTQGDGISQLPNGQHGVSVFGSAGNSIGGMVAGSGNVIAYNTNHGVRVSGSAATGNTVRRNSIHANGQLGIENESGGNAELPPPVITSVNPDTSTISGTTCSGCTVEVFSDGVDEGRVFQGVATTSGNDWTFTGTFAGPQLTTTATDGSGNTSEFSSPVPLVVLGAGSGDPAPDTGGGTLGTSADLGVNDSGQAVFRNTVDGGTAGVSEGIFAFFGANPNPTSVVLEGQNTQTAIGGDYAAFGPPVNNNAGTIVYRANLVNGPNQGVFAFFGASTEALAWQGGTEPLPHTGIFSTFAAPAVNNLNQVAVTSTLTSGQPGLYAFFGASPTSDVRLGFFGETAPGGVATYAGFGDPSINDAGQVAARATLSGSSEGLFAFFAAGSQTELIAKKDDSAPGTGVNGKFNSFGNPSINNLSPKGRVAARATINGGTASEGVFAFFGASPTQALALQGQIAPGADGAAYASFGDPVINDLGQVVVKANLTGGLPGAPTEGIFAFFGATALPLVLEGDVAPEGGTYGDFLHIAFNDVAQIVFVANVNTVPISQGVFFASLDLDRDGFVDFQDNCATVFNPDQNNADAALAAGGASVAADALGNACDLDDDNDQFSDLLEVSAGTNPLDNCAAGPGTGGDAWPADTNRDGFSDITDLGAIVGYFGKAVPPAPARLNIAPDPPDGFVDITDVGMVAGLFGKGCT